MKKIFLVITTLIVFAESVFIFKLYRTSETLNLQSCSGVADFYVEKTNKYIGKDTTVTYIETGRNIASKIPELSFSNGNTYRQVIDGKNPVRMQVLRAGGWVDIDNVELGLVGDKAELIYIPNRKSHNKFMQMTIRRQDVLNKMIALCNLSLDDVEGYKAMGFTNGL